MRTAMIFRTAALAAMTCAVVFSLIRVLSPASFLPGLFGVAVAAHLCAAVTRRSGAVFSIPAMTLIGALVCIGASHGGATTFGVPTPDTFDTIGSSLSAALHTLREASPPVPPEPGLVLIVAAAVWVAAWSADRLTFVHDAAAAAIVPTATIFVVVTALAGDADRWLPVGLYAGAVALHLLSARHLAVGRAPAGTVGTPRWGPVAGGAGVAAATILAGLGAAATIPALDFPGVAQIRQDRSIEVTPPLIDLRDQLVDPTDEELFRTSGGGAHYWRLTAYDSFDGSRWRLSPSRSRRVDGSLGGDPTEPATGRMDTVTTTFELTGLGGTFAPAAFRPELLTAPPTRSQGRPAPKMRWDPENLALVVGSGDGGVEGLTYTVSSRIPSVDAAALVGSGADPSDGTDPFTELPARVREALTPEALAIVGDVDDPYARAIALQNHFRENFTYSTDLTGITSDPDHALGESVEAVLAFLDNRVGYCVHFAGAYAALARSIGLPARVAVGFTPGEPLGDDPDHRVVRGRNAHVWPEVYFTGRGWLPFEPSPGRGNADATSYTGVDGVDDPNRQPGTGGAGTVPTTTTPDDAAGSPTAVPTTVPDVESDTATGPTDSMKPPSTGPGRGVIGLIGAIVAVALLAGTPFVLRGLLRRRRRARATSPARRVRLAWTDTLHAWYDLDLRRSPVDTDRDLGERLADRTEVLTGHVGSGDDARRLAELATAASWNAAASDDDDVAAARVLADRLGAVALRHRSRAGRLRGWFVVRYRGGV